MLIGPEAGQSLDHLIALVAGYRQQYGPVRGIVHLAPLQAPPEPSSLTDWQAYLGWHSKVLFYLMQLSSEDLQQWGQGRVVAASLLGGYFGRDGQTDLGLASGGSSGGLIKTMVNEWPTVHGKTLDFDASLPATAIADHILQELRLPGGRIEVGYPQGIRTIFRTVPVPLFPSSSAWSPQADWVVMATGGARGITAEILMELAAVGCTLILLGRSPLPETEPEATRGLTNRTDLRQWFLTQARTQGQTPTPVQIERQIQALWRSREIRQSLEQFHRLGARVEYWSVDVANGEALGTAIDRIYDQYGRLDVAVHGAGLILDKLIQDKTAAAFDQVFDTKVNGALTLSYHLRPEGLKALIFFSSVAGRYGNQGQCDYAAANEVMNRLAWQLSQRWPQTRVVALNWGPWDTTGMASETVKQQFRDRGIEPIPLTAGRQFFYDELRYGSSQAVEVIAGAGPWEADEQEKGQLHSANASEHPTAETVPVTLAAVDETPSRTFPLILTAPSLCPDSTVMLEHHLHLETDLYLSDHRLDGKPVLPAAGALEWIAEFAQVAWPDWVVAEVRDLRVMRGLVLDNPAGRPIRLQAKASSHADASALQVTVEIVDPERQLPFYRAYVILRPSLPSPPSVDELFLEDSSPLTVVTAYRDYLFHGPRFQLIQAVEGISPQGIDALVQPSQPQAWLGPQSLPGLSPQASWLFDPGLVDVPPQLAIVWSRVYHQTTALPSRLGAVVRYGSAPPAGPLRCLFRITSADSTSCNYDAWYVDGSGAVYLQMQAIESTCNSSLNRLAQQP